MSSTLTEIELAARWSMSPKTLQRWRTTRFGPAYLKLGKKIQYQLSTIESYENQVRTNVANEGTEEIILYLRQTGQATVDQIRSACLGGKKSRNQIQQYLYRLTRSTPPKIQASIESPRELRRLLTLRRWSHEQQEVQPFFPRGARACRADGA